jgi:PHD-finger
MADKEGKEKGGAKGTTRGKSQKGAAGGEPAADICKVCREYEGKDGKEEDKWIMCELCNQWSHTTCVNLEDSEYELLRKSKRGTKQLHWFCQDCNMQAVEILKNINEIKCKTDKMEKGLADLRNEVSSVNNIAGEGLDRAKKAEAEAVNLKAELVVLRKEMSTMNTRLDGGLKQCKDGISKCREEIKGTDIEKVQKLVEDKVKEVEEKVSNQNRQVTELKKEMITTTDEKIDNLVKQKFTEKMREEQERRLRQCNVIVFGIEESASMDSEVRIADDVDAMKDILASIKTDNAEMKQLIRLGKKPEAGTDAKPRPLKVVFENEAAKNEVLEKARNLKKTKNCQIFIVQDMTPLERQRRKELVAERDYRKSQGEDVLIYKDKVVVRRARPDMQ